MFSSVPVPNPSHEHGETAMDTYLPRQNIMQEGKNQYRIRSVSRRIRGRQVVQA